MGEVILLISKYIDTERIIHSVKTAIACILGYLLITLTGLHGGQWVIISIIVVMCAQIYVGSVLQKAYLRFLGTFIGCLLAAITIASFGNTHLIIALTVGFSSLIFSYIATGQESFAYAGTLGAVTTAIIMLGQSSPTVLIAFERFLDISIGILIASLVSQFILPIHARNHLRRAQALTVHQLHDYYQQIMATTKEDDKKMLVAHEIDESIVKSLLKQRQLAKESRRERLGPAFSSDHFVQTLYAEREILRAITFMHHALTNIRQVDSFMHTQAMKIFNETILAALETLSEAIEKGSSKRKHIHIPSISPLQMSLEKNVRASANDEMMYVDGFLFSAEMLTNSLKKLADLYHLPVMPPPLT